MEDKLDLLQSKEFGMIRVAMRNDEPYFAVTDVCRALGIEHVHSVVTRLREEAAASKNPQHVVGGSTTTLPVVVISLDTCTRTGVQPLVYTNEPGLYSTILLSRKPSALAFKAWIVGDILPKLRKTGTYSMTQPKTYVEALEAHHEVLGKLIGEVKRREKLEVEQAELKLLNAELEPKAAFTDAVTESHDAVDIGLMARMLGTGMGQNRMFKYLRTKKLLMPDNRAYQEYIDRGYFRTVMRKWTSLKGETKVAFQTRVYPKGIRYVYQLLTADGITAVLPVKKWALAPVNGHRATATVFDPGAI